jgi:phosphoribosyl 1,2-cyclic phosphodiesterase
MSFEAELWGVRGSIACPSPDYMTFGGNTSCVELRLGEERLILDAGTGLRNLGNHYMRSDVRRARLLLTHTHWDHINGFPFFKPGFQADRVFEIMSGHLESGTVRDVLAGQMAQATFPVPLEAMRARLVFEDFVAGDAFTLPGGISIRTAPLRHPNRATGYRIEYAGKALCYVTDTEHTVGTPDQNVLGLIEGADVVLYDSTYTDEEFPERLTWGHSTWQEGIRLCRIAGAKTIVLFHHDPDHDDLFLQRVADEARATWDRAVVARERMSLVLG